MSSLDADTYAIPNPTASLLLSHRPAAGKVVLVLGTGKLAASRCFACLEAGITPIVLSVTSAGEARLRAQEACPELQHRINTGAVLYHRIEPSSFATQHTITAQWNQILDQYDAGSDPDTFNAIFAVCVTDTLHSGDQPEALQHNTIVQQNAKADSSTTLSTYLRAKLISRLCRKRRIPINVADKPELCDFSFPASHRFPCTSPVDGQGASSSSLQIAVTTNGRGCRLAGRIRREIVSALPRNVGDAVDKVGVMRDLAKHHIDTPSHHTSHSNAGTAQVEEEDLSFDTTPLNSPVPQLHPKNPIDQSVVARLRSRDIQLEVEQERAKRREEAAERTKRRMRWVAQISEYWPIEYLGDLQNSQMQQVLKSYGDDAQATTSKAASVIQDADSEVAIKVNEESRGRSKEASAAPSFVQRGRSQHSLDIRPPQTATSSRGHIYLLGSGPGHPGLLTTFAHRLLVSPNTDLILSDKLVPSSILKLIPNTTPLEIARKFPGNAEGAQSELIAKALKAALEEGKTVVRLKQGDPFVYGRGGEEVLAFRKAGIECTVVPGISSSIAAPALLGIPVTQRGAADSLVLCTGVGKGGRKVRLPGYKRGRTLVVLMGVARLEAVVKTLIGAVSGQDDTDMVGDRDGPAFPSNVPIAIIERASSSDQRMVASTLDGIVNALERSGEQRPPGMMVIGWSILSLEGTGDNTIQDDAFECGNDEEELKKRDADRIQKWLQGRKFIVKEGLDASYKAALDSFRNFPDYQQQDVAIRGGLLPVDEERSRSETGWAPARYANGVPEGGWLPGETPNYPAHDSLKYHQDQAYAEVQARLKTLAT